MSLCICLYEIPYSHRKSEVAFALTFDDKHALKIGGKAFQHFRRIEAFHIHDLAFVICYLLLY